MIYSVPWWVYLAFAGVIFSAYMIIRTSKEERQIDEDFIEREGQVYIERMHAERENKDKAETKVESI